jgi:hypothetical protein
MTEVEARQLRDLIAIMNALTGVCPAEHQAALSRAIVNGERLLTESTLEEVRRSQGSPPNVVDKFVWAARRAFSHGVHAIAKRVWNTPGPNPG